MTRQTSFTKHKQQLLPGYREMLDQAESTEDVKKFYTQTMQDLLARAMDAEQPLDFEDATLTPDQVEGYVFSPRLVGREAFQAAWADSDLPHIVRDFTDRALNRYKHLEKNPAKTNAKIHHVDGKR